MKRTKDSYTTPALLLMSSERRNVCSDISNPFGFVNMFGFVLFICFIHDFLKWTFLANRETAVAIIQTTQSDKSV